MFRLALKYMYIKFEVSRYIKYLNKVQERLGRIKKSHGLKIAPRHAEAFILIVNSVRGSSIVEYHFDY